MKRAFRTGAKSEKIAPFAELMSDHLYFLALVKHKNKNNALQYQRLKLLPKSKGKSYEAKS